MHALLAHLYHLVQFGMQVLLRPLWRAPGAALLVAGIARLAWLKRGRLDAGLAAGAAVLAGWLLLDPHSWAWPPPPVARLPGLAVILLAGQFWRASGRTRLLVLPVTAGLAAWWLRGAPGDGNAILNSMPVFLGLLAALPFCRRLARGDHGWAGLVAAASLAGALLLTGAAVHWARAAGVAAAAAAALLGVGEAAEMIAGAVVMVAAACIVASDRGRLIPVDAACLVPLLAWLIVPRLVAALPRRGSAAPAGRKKSAAAAGAKPGPKRRAA